MVAEEKMAAEQWVGRTIAGKYRVDGLLGKGGMGLVLRARHLRLEEDVAIKVLLPAMLEVPGMVTRFVREARAASKIKSQHVVRVTDVDLLDDGVPYMVMELLEGVSVAALRRREGKFTIVDATRFILEACDAIAEAHSLGIVHRDLKPANLFVARGRDGANTVKVLDFGISKVDAPGEQDTTKTGQMMGSPKYMAPEQMLSMHDVDGRADIWSLGAIFYDMLTGRTPFVADTVAQLCSAVLHERPRSPREFRPELPEDLEAAIMRCLSRDRAERFPNVAAFAEAVAPFAGDGTSESRRFTFGTAPSVERGPDGVPTLTTVGGRRDTGRTAAGSTPASVTPPSGTPASVTPSSVTPPSTRTPTVAAWQATPQATPPAPRPTRLPVVGAGVALAAIALGALVFFGRQRDDRVMGLAHASTAAAATNVEEAKAPSATPSSLPAPQVVEVAAAPTASAQAKPEVAAATTAIAVDAAPRNVVTPTVAPPKTVVTKRVPRTPAEGGGESDPFGGKRH